jgi:hypothetical protein
MSIWNRVIAWRAISLDCRIAAEKPLLMAEIGLDSRRNGLAAQADSLDWQIRTAFAAGCVGAFAFAWTDEWYRGGQEIEDWDFADHACGSPPALAVATRAFSEAPFPDTGGRGERRGRSCNGVRTSAHPRRLGG